MKWFKFHCFLSAFCFFAGLWLSAFQLKTHLKRVSHVFVVVMSFVLFPLCKSPPQKLGWQFTVARYICSGAVGASKSHAFG